MFDVLGEMWGTLLLDSLAMLFGVTGLLGICAKDTTIIILVSHDHHTGESHCNVLWLVELF